ncbi:hypothetical protein FACS1894218_4180 [Bacilli bacterium]|nr:hypothetical protein FACS1894218_4180 [Bacilli bacterium]
MTVAKNNINAFAFSEISVLKVNISQSNVREPTFNEKGTINMRTDTNFVSERGIYKKCVVHNT